MAVRALADDAFVAELQKHARANTGDWRWPWLESLLHLERGDAKTAVQSLEEALARNANDDRVHSMLALAREREKTWNLCIRTFAGHSDDVRSVVMSKDGSWALSGSGDKTLRLWEVSTGRCTKVLEGHEDGVNVHSLERRRSLGTVGKRG